MDRQERALRRAASGPVELRAARNLERRRRGPDSLAEEWAKHAASRHLTRFKRPALIERTDTLNWCQNKAALGKAVLAVYGIKNPQVRLSVHRPYAYVNLLTGEVYAPVPLASGSYVPDLDAVGNLYDPDEGLSCIDFPVPRNPNLKKRPTT